jgi:CRISPR-associated endonuclease Cas1
MKHKHLHLPKVKVIAGFGSHIKATRDNLIVQRKGRVLETPLSDLDHLIIIGGHNIQTSALTSLLHKQIFISFFESDGEPAGYLKPYGYQMDDAIEEISANIPPFSYALVFAKSSVKERIFAIEQWNEEIKGGILFAGELEVLTSAANELDNFIKIEEILRIDRLIGDMYYEIMSRLIPADLAFKRRTERPYRDPVNTILSFGYTILIGDCTKALVSIHLNPDEGMLNRGKRSLCLDFANIYKTRMIDKVALSLIRNGKIRPESYDCGEKRCILADSLIKELISLFQDSINQDIINTQIKTFIQALNGEVDFEIHRF